MPGTPQHINMSTMKLCPAHFRIIFIASLGQFLGQGLATLVGIVIPLLQLTLNTGLPSGIQGILGCISLIGIMIGSAVIGNLSDRYGYLLLFRLCPVICGLSALSVVFFPNVIVLIIALFIMGFAVGGEYSLDPNYISELMPDRWKVFMVGVAKALASAGSAFVAIICYIILSHGAHPKVWSMLMLIIVGICIIMAVMRIGFAQSPDWLIEHGKEKQAEQAVEKLLGKDVEISTPPTSTQNTPVQTRQVSIWSFIYKQFRRVILTGVPWACEGLGVYGIGIFLPVLIMAFGLDMSSGKSLPVERITHSVGLTFILCIVMMIGFAVGLSLLRKMKHIRIQIWGFWLSMIGLGILLAAYLLHWHIAVAISGFVLFELALNAGPHLITFILPSQVFAIDDRGTGAGVAASIGKSGAVLGAFCIPVTLHHWGATGVLIVSIIVMGLGALITWIFGHNINK